MLVGPSLRHTSNISDLIGIDADVILIDAPLAFAGWSPKGEGRSPQHHYECWNLERLHQLPVRKIAGPNCFVFSWVPLRSVYLVVPLFESWGVTFSGSGLEWVKTLRTKPGFWSAGGYTTRKNIEVAWLGRIGKPQRANKDVPALIVAPHREHSRKPDEQYERIERLVGPGKVLVELFARQRRPGWHCFGNQLDQFNADSESTPQRRHDNTSDGQLELALTMSPPVTPTTPAEPHPLDIPPFLRRTV
jgi:N6-adenosine-specific RNA methylase IME4